MHRWCGAVRPHWPHISGRISASCVDMGCAAAGRGGAPGSAPNDMVRLGAEIDEGQKEERGERAFVLWRIKKNDVRKTVARAPPAQLIPARRDGDGMSGDMEAAWDCVHKLFKLFDRKQTGPLRPPPPATRTPPCSRERSRSVRVPLPAAGVPSQHPLPRWLATAADTPRPRLPCLQAR